jgi:hypothetical protein
VVDGGAGLLEVAQVVTADQVALLHNVPGAAERGDKMAANEP